jgi:hypothetical protein
MQKPEVRIIEPQQEESKPVDASQSERDYLLFKYGYKSEPSKDVDVFNTNDPLQKMTADQFAELNDRNYYEMKKREHERRNRPRAFTFDNVNYSESKYSNFDLDGYNLGIQVQITSDMPINNNNRRW